MSTITATLGTDRARRLRAALTVLLAAALAVGAPFYFAPFQVFQLTMVLLYAVALAGLNLLVGFGGQISLGHGAFFAAGAYTAAVMLDRYDTGHWATLPVAAAGCFLLGLGFGVPALRLRGLYLALVTLAFAVFLPPLLKRLEPVTGGSMGLTVDKPQPPAWSGLAEDQWTYFVVLAVTALALLLARNLLRSRVGRALLALRDNESAAEVMGVRLSLHKTLAFAWSAMFAGVAGCLYTWVIGFVSPDSFSFVLSITLLAGLVVGGLGSLYGPLLGAAFVMYVPSVSQDLSEAAPGVVFGLLIITVMFVAPTGLAGLPGRVRAVATRRLLSRAATPERTPEADSAPDTGPSAPADSVADVGSVASLDSSPDVEPAASADSVADAGPSAPADSVADVGSVASLDSSPDVEPAASADSAPDAEPNPPADSAPDAQPDSDSPAAPESSATDTPADPAVADAEPVGAPPRTEKE